MDEPNGVRTCLCVSGGGTRAALFALGALLYLVDAGKGRDLAAVSSVSGGSMTNAWVGLRTDLTVVDPESFGGLAGELAERLACRGTLWASPLTLVWCAAAAVPVVAVTTVSVLALRSSTLATGWVVAVWVLALLWLAAVLPQRSRVASHAFDRTLYRGARLEDLHGGVDHVLCATDLQTGQNFFFSNRFVYSWGTGYGVTAGLPLAVAVQASACLPGAFPPRWIRTEPHQFPKETAPRHLVLTDGGVYDNMGTEWALRAAGGFDPGSGPPPTPAPRRINEVIVVNASAAPSETRRGWVRIPLVGEFFALIAAKDVLYSQTTAVRRRLLNLRYQIAELPDTPPGDQERPAPLRGATVQIDRSPLALPLLYADGTSAASDRARAVLAVLEPDAERWRTETDANCAVGTTLSRVPRDRARSLILHAYVLTMSATHVLLDYPLLPVPEPARTEAWLR